MPLGSDGIAPACDSGGDNGMEVSYVLFPVIQLIKVEQRCKQSRRSNLPGMGMSGQDQVAACRLRLLIIRRLMVQ